MKVVAGDSVTLIYPFITPDGEPGNASSQIVVWPNRSIKLLMGNPLMDIRAARTLAQALEYAAGLAEKRTIQ